MARQHGITTETYERLIIDAGQVRINYVDENNPGTLLGATRGGSVFAVETELREMPVDGAKGPVKGDKRITKVTASLECNFIESTTDLLMAAIPGSSKADWPNGSPTHDAITRALGIASADYFTNVTIIGEISGSAEPIILQIQNALADGKLSLGLNDNDEAANKIKFIGHFDPADLDAEPWVIYQPQDVNPTTEGA